MRHSAGRANLLTRRNVAGGLAAAFALAATRDTSSNVASASSGQGALPAWNPDSDPLAALRGGERLDIRRFGARGNGAAIDTLAVNSAIRAARPGQTLYFPPGTYLIDGSELQTVAGIGTVHTVPLANGVNLLMEPGAWLKRAPADTGGPIFLTALGNNIIQANLDGDEYPLSGGMAGNWRTDGGVGLFAVDSATVTVVNSLFRHLTYGIEARGLSRWRILNCDFDRMKLSGCLLRGSSTMAAQGNLVKNCRFRDMGDTAVAFHYVTGDAVVAYNLVEDCIARNTQMRVDGYAFDVEGAVREGTHHHNVFRRLIVEQEAVSGFVQGGATINKYSSQSLIADCRLRGNGSKTGIGISVIETDSVDLINNRIEGFAANAIYADGADRSEISGNVIIDCGDGASFDRSAILLAFAKGSKGVRVTRNDMSWPRTGPRRGSAGAAIAARNYLLDGVEDLSVAGNRIRFESGNGILVEAPSSLSSVRRIAIEDNIVAAGPGGDEPVAVRNAADVRIRKNRIAGGNGRIDTAGSRGVAIADNVLETPGL